MNQRQSAAAILILIMGLLLSGCGAAQPTPYIVLVTATQPAPVASIPTWSQLPSPTVTPAPPTATPKDTRTPTLTPTLTPTRPTLAPTLTQTLPTLNPTEAALSAMMIKWLDNLKTCTPYTVSFPNPFLPVNQTQTIKGKDGDLCQVTYETPGKYLVNCRFSPEGIKVMTSDPFYEDVKNNRWLIAYDSEHNTAGAKVMSQECKVTQLSTP
jgi:hypothetical protein